MTVRDLLRPLPGMRRLSLLRQQIAFRSSVSYWERRYAHGGTSGDGSYGTLGEAKAVFLNGLVRDYAIRSVIEFGCGDGHQLELSNYSRYVGLDVSRTALGLCERRFAEDQSKSFFLYDGACFVDHARLFTAELAVSLDVIYHLVEDVTFETYMKHLFAAGEWFVVVYSTDIEAGATAHVRHRRFTAWVEKHCPQWHLMQVTPGPSPGPIRADFHVYQRRITGSFPGVPALDGPGGPDA